MPELRPYQQEDLIHLSRFDNAGCFNEQRTGKTPTSLMLMKSRNLKKILIVCPASLMYKWKDEFELWVGRPCLVVSGTKKRRTKMIDLWTDGLVINYETLRNMNRTISKDFTEELVGHHAQLMKHKPDGCILDEAHRIKGRKTATAKAVYKLKKIPHKVALTGTPAPTHPADVWAILHWLWPDIYTSYWKYIDKNFRTTPGYGPHSRDVQGFKLGRERLVAKELDQFCTNRKRKDVMPWLPDIPEPTAIRLPVNTAQMRYLAELESMFMTDHVITEGIIDRLTRLRQVCAAPALLGLRGRSPKIDWLDQYIKDYPDTSMVVFSRFSKFLRLIEKEIPGKVYVIDGSTPPEERQDLINKFQGGKIKVLLFQIDAGKEGITLDAGEKLIFMDVSPPAADISQAKDRIIATTQDKAAIPKEIINVMMRDTYDEQLYNMVAEQREFTAVINDYINYLTKE